MRAPTTLHLVMFQRKHHRRGVAMLLVILCLSFATIVSVAYLASRDNADMIGENVANAADARWAAESGLAVGIGALQTQSNWRTEHNAGLLYDNLPFSNATVSITLSDSRTGAPPTATTEYVDMYVLADRNGLERAAIARLYVPITTDGSYDADLSEFAVFAIETLEVLDKATLAAWESTPNRNTSSKVNVGTTATNASSIQLGLNAAPLDVNVYNGPGASTFLISNDSAFDIVNVDLSDNMAVPAPPTHGQATPDSSGITPLPLVLDSATHTLAITTRFATGNLVNNSTLNVNDGVILIIDDDLTLGANSRLRIGGDVELIVFGNLTIADSAVEIADGAQLRTWVRGNIVLKHAFLGPENPDRPDYTVVVNQFDETAPYFPVPRLKIYGIDPASYSPGTSSPTWSFDSNSVLKGIGYSPYARVSINTESALFGRLLAKQITLTDESGLYFDATLNDNRGYTVERTLLFQGDGSLRPEVVAYTQLTGADGVSHVETIIAPTGTVPVDILEITLAEEAVRLALAPPSGTGPADPIVVEADTRSAQTTWSNFSVTTDYSSTIITVAMAQRSAIIAEFQAAADAIAINDYTSALTNLQNILDRIDGDSTVTDYLNDSVQKTALFDSVTGIVADLNTLL